MSVSPKLQGRMLLSHNFDVAPDQVPALSREAFTEVFRVGLAEHDQLHCRLIDHPHWILEIRFPAESFTPSQVGLLCATALADKRRSQSVRATAFPDILVLGGIKTTPPTNSSPDALQPGEWGVDVVETADGTTFLQAISWEETIASKPADSVFKVEWKEV
ncbi:MAG: DUF2656 domain-containing protein [Cyanobacteria bacterium J06638_20]